MAYFARITYWRGHIKADRDHFEICYNIIWFISKKFQICLLCGKQRKNTHKEFKHKNILIDNVSEDFIDSI